MPLDYYVPPAHSIFGEIKAKSIEVWETCDNEYGYVDEKVDRIKPLRNIRDNALTIVAMFDNHNKLLLFQKLSPHARMWLYPYLKEYAQEGQKIVDQLAKKSCE